MTKLIFKYFWVLAVLSGFLNYLFIRHRALRNSMDEKDNEELKNLLRGILAYLTLPFLLIGILQMLGGFQSLFFVLSRDYHNPYVLLSWIILISWWVLTLYWVLYKDGTTLLIKYQHIFRGNFPSNETMIKLFFILTTTVGLIGMYFGVMNDFYSRSVINLP